MCGHKKHLGTFLCCLRRVCAYSGSQNIFCLTLRIHFFLGFCTLIPFLGLLTCKQLSWWAIASLLWVAPSSFTSVRKLSASWFKRTHEVHDWACFFPAMISTQGWPLRKNNSSLLPSICHVFWWCRGSGPALRLISAALGNVPPWHKYKVKAPGSVVHGLFTATARLSGMVAIAVWHLSLLFSQFYKTFKAREHR